VLAADSADQTSALRGGCRTKGSRPSLFLRTGHERPATSTSWSTTPGSRCSARRRRSRWRRTTRCSSATSGRRFSRRGVGSRAGRARPRQHHQLEQHGRRSRSRRRRGLRRDEGVPRDDDSRWRPSTSASGVRVSAVAPGAGLHADAPGAPRSSPRWGETTPMRRASHPEVIAFLASARASYITGATIAGDGGRRAV
jgi:hypothetical protein